MMNGFHFAQIEYTDVFMKYQQDLYVNFINLTDLQYNFEQNQTDPHLGLERKWYLIQLLPLIGLDYEMCLCAGLTRYAHINQLVNMV